jgi:hypothetical protein
MGAGEYRLPMASDLLLSFIALSLVKRSRKSSKASSVALSLPISGFTSVPISGHPD